LANYVEIIINPHVLNANEPFSWLSQMQNADYFDWKYSECSATPTSPFLNPPSLYHL
jgi:hypothetical protein